MELYIIRHGETDWNVEQRMQGRSDIPLNAYGIELAEITAKALENVDFDAIYASPLKRAYKTAEILRGARNLPIITDDRLKEMCFGDYEGRPNTEIADAMNVFFNDPVHFVPAPHGETYEEVLKRTSEFINDIIVPDSARYNRILVVAHGALNKGLMVNLNHQTVAEYWTGVFQKNCCVNIYEIQGHQFTCLQNGKIYYQETKNINWGRD